MFRTLPRFLVTAAILLSGASVYAQSAPSPASSAPTTDLFSGVHEALDRSVNTLLTEQGRPRTHAGPATDRMATMGSSSQVSLEEGLTEQAVSARTLTPAMRRLDELRPLLDPILKREGIPLEIALVVVAESGVRADALSPKGARGLWQLMPETARRYGLVVEGERDERLDVEKSTRAAAQYLRDLRTQFKSWPLALAAYNAGEQTVQNAIARAGDNTFAVLRSRQLLPTETRDYVSAVINLIARSGSSNDFTEQVRRRRDQWIVYAGRE